MGIFFFAKKMNFAMTSNRKICRKILKKGEQNDVEDNQKKPERKSESEYQLVYRQRYA